jgi:hypothetical protein
MGQMRKAFSILIGKPEGKNHLEDLGVDGRIILQCILYEMGWKVVDWVNLTEVRDQIRGLVNTVMDFRFP